jgi:hypothetical protein
VLVLVLALEQELELVLEALVVSVVLVAKVAKAEMLAMCWLVSLKTQISNS